MTIDVDLHLGTEPGAIVHRNQYGQFAEHLGTGIYEGVWVGEDSSIPNVRGIRTDVVDALRALEVPVIRWPGGCFADEYHWKDGVGPRSERPAVYNSHWGGVQETNHFGTHEFMDLCDQVGAEPYVCGNVGSGTVREMREWVEYLTSESSPMADLRRRNGRTQPWSLPYFGVGNENWGCGGNMRPEFYADEYRRFATYVRSTPSNRVAKFACGANAGDFKWTEVLMERAAAHMDGLSLHYYTTLNGWPPAGSSIDYGREEWRRMLRQAFEMDRLLREHTAIMDLHDPTRRVGLIVDEWGTWHAVEPGTNPGFLYQQNSMRDAMVAALTLHLFHAYADRVTMANIAQMVNVLQAMILTDGPQMLRTPTYWTFHMLNAHRGGAVLKLDGDRPVYGEGDAAYPNLSTSATRGADGSVTLSFANLDADQAIDLTVNGTPANASGARILTGSSITDHNTFESPDRVMPTPWEVRVNGGRFEAELPPHSVAVVRLS